MKKRLLLIACAQGSIKTIGGTGRSLLALLNAFDYDKYSVDIVTLGCGALFTELIPPQVHRIHRGECSLKMLKDAGFSWVDKIKYLFITIVINLIYLFKIAEIIGKISVTYSDKISWLLFKLLLFRVQDSYDAAIGFSTEYVCQKYLLEKVEAKKKISYIHIDFSRFKPDGKEIRAYKNVLAKPDVLIAVSETARRSLISIYPELTAKTIIIKNIVAASDIRRLSLVGRNIDLPRQHTVVTVAGLGSEKGVDLALHALRILKNGGYKIKWYIIGDGELCQTYKQLAVDQAVSDYAIFLGTLENPFPVVVGCDIYVQPSRSESYCLAVDEALILNKPVIATDLPAFKARLTDGDNALLVPATASAIAKAVRKLITDCKLRAKLAEGASRLDLDTTDEIKKIYSLLE